MLKRIVLFTITSCIMAFCALGATAASGIEGYAVYRDGVPALQEWHSAIMIRPSKFEIPGNTPVVVHANLGSKVTVGSWAAFLNGNNNEMGVYAPQMGISPAGRDLVMNTARSLTNYDIEYTWGAQIGYSVSNSGGFLNPWQISRLRCDGVVEYAFEANYYRICGSSTYDWNICTDSQINYDYHGSMWPTVQAQWHMSRIGNIT